MGFHVRIGLELTLLEGCCCHGKQIVNQKLSPFDTMISHLIIDLTMFSSSLSLDYSL